MTLQRFEGTTWVDAGLSRRGMSVEGCLLAAAPNAPTTGTVEQVLATINLPNKVLNNNSDCLIVDAFLLTAGTANTKQLRIRQGNITGTILLDTGAVGANAQAGYGELYLFRVSGGPSGLVVGLGFSQVGTTVGTTINQLTLNPNTGLPVLVITGTSTTAAGDMTLVAYRVLVGREGGVQSASGILL